MFFSEKLNLINLIPIKFLKKISNIQTSFFTQKTPLPLTKINHSIKEGREHMKYINTRKYPERRLDER